MRFLAALNAGFLAWAFGGALDVPIWRDGWLLEAIGDRTDMAVAAFAMVFCTLSFLKAHSPNREIDHGK